jgi:general secretion pathway protein C
MHSALAQAGRLSRGGKVRAAGCALSAISRTVEKQLQRLPLYLSLAIAALLALQVSGLAWSFVHSGGGKASPRAAQPRPRAAPLNVGQVIAAHLFGQAEADPSTAVPTQLPLQLVGTWADVDPAFGMAMVRESEGAPQKLVRVGEEMPGGATLREVYARRIVFERDGRFEDLAFPENPLQQADPPSIHAVESMPVEGEEGTPAAQEEPPAAEPEPAVEAPAEGGDAEH